MGTAVSANLTRLLVLQLSAKAVEEQVGLLLESIGFGKGTVVY